jgi:hypothetical protein
MTKPGLTLSTGEPAITKYPPRHPDHAAVLGQGGAPSDFATLVSGPTAKTFLVVISAAFIGHSRCISIRRTQKRLADFSLGRVMSPSTV